jgi:hypothetical protein
MLTNFKNGLTIIGITFVALSATAFIKSDVAIAGGFSQTCTDINLDKKTAKLTAKCEDGNQMKKIWVPASIELNNHVGSSQGNLLWQEIGNFSQFCPVLELSFITDLTILKTSCQVDPLKNRYLYKDSMLVLDEKITNRNGRLVYEDWDDKEPKPDFDICATPQGPAGNPLGPNVCTKP